MDVNHQPDMDNEVFAMINDPVFSSQDFVQDILHPRETDTKEKDEIFEFDSMFDVLFDSDRATMTRAGLTEESIALLSSPENDKSKKIYQRHQERYIDYVKANGYDEFDESTVVNYFTEMYNEGQYSVGTFWCIFSCIRSYLLVKTKVDIKSFALLRKLIKGLTEKHIKKKASIFTGEEMKKVLMEMYNEDDPQDLLEKITVSLMYYGLLRGGEVLQIEKKDVRLDLTEDIEVDFPYKTKRSAKGFSFKLPRWLKDCFAKYLGQFPDESENPKLLKNWTKCKNGKGRKQNLGGNKLGSFPKKLVSGWVQTAILPHILSVVQEQQLLRSQVSVS